MITRVIVGSTNPVKINAVRLAFESFFPQQHLSVTGVATDSTVSSQPMGDTETKKGANARANHVMVIDPTADFAVGIEGGIEVLSDKTWNVMAWITILEKNNTYRSCTKSATFPLPPPLISLMQENPELELGSADDVFFKRRNSKQTDGIVGKLTSSVITRTSYYVHPITLALIPFCSDENKELY